MRDGLQAGRVMDYRPDLQGLRALAILVVVAAHAGLPHLEGGFVGVDVFFVLSGYLITGMLLRELRLQGTLDLAAFYARRLRRLLPALLFMLACTALASILLLAPFEQQAQAPAFVAAALWLANIHFAVTDAGYFEAGSEHSLVLHTWSLAVEEQFYLFWPLLLLALAGSSVRLGRVLPGLALAAVLSFALCQWLTVEKPLWAFYAMPTRAWQFALGGLVFLMLDRRSQMPAPPGQKVLVHVKWMSGTARLLDALSPAIDRIHVIRATPQLPFDGPACLARMDWQPAVSLLTTECSATARSAGGDDVAAALYETASRYANVSVLDFNPLVCPDGVCHAARGELLVFRDALHLADGYVRSVADEIGALVDVQQAL